MLTLLLGALLAAPPAFDPLAELDAYNVVWRSPSADASGSMPLGNGEVGVNLWIEPNGDVVFYVSRTDAWSENARLLKLGKVRISADPPFWRDDDTFRQELVLRAGKCDVAFGEGAAATRLSLFVDAEAPVIYVVGTAGEARTVRASFEGWRDQRRVITDPDEMRSAWAMHDAPATIEVSESADACEVADGRLRWRHRNEHSIVPLSIEHQGLQSIRAHISDPLLHRTFGGVVSGEGFGTGGEREIRTENPVSSFVVRITTHCAQTATAAEWDRQIDEADRKAVAAKDAERRTAAWWSRLWKRSWVFVEGDVAGEMPRNAHAVRVGADSSGGNAFRGDMSRITIMNGAMTDAEIAALAGAETSGPAPAGPRIIGVLAGASDDASWRADGAVAADSSDAEPRRRFSGGHYLLTGSEGQAFADGFTIEARIRPEAIGDGRIVDKLTPGGSDGFLFDLHGGLRLIVGHTTLTAPNAIAVGKWQHVAAKFDPSRGAGALYVNGRRVAGRDDGDPVKSRVTRAYILQRWMTACGGRGEYPIKFNGSIFTVEPRFINGKPFNADWRAWGGDFWWQNTRLPYYAMLGRADFEMMKPLFAFYSGLAPACAARARLYYGAEGVYFPETMTMFGTYSNGDYGWKREGLEASNINCPWWQYAWNQGPELVDLMLSYYDYTHDDEFATTTLLPMARDVLRYFETRFLTGDRFVISPSQSLETYWTGVVNDAPCVAGLHAVLEGLTGLPERVTTAEDREIWKRLRAALPQIPTIDAGGAPMLAAAEAFDPKRSNCETPELAAVFPFAQYGIGRPDIDLAKRAYAARIDRSSVGWTQDAMFAAALGNVADAKAQMLARSGNSHPAFRFPAMWGPNFDWTPDQCHGANLMTTLQMMLVQPVGDEIHALPAWPKDWSARFRLHLPGATAIEGHVRDGMVVDLKLEPMWRSRHLKMHKPQ